MTEAPKAVPARPRFAVPAGAADTHFHVFGPPERYPYVPDRIYTPDEAPLAGYLAMATRIGCERTVIVHPTVYGTDTACTLDAVAELGGARAQAIALVAPEAPLGELARLDAAGVRGVRLNLAISAGTEIEPLLEDARALGPRIAPLGWHLQAFVPGALLAPLVAGIKGLAVDFVIDHMGMVPAPEADRHEGLAALSGLLAEGGCWVKISGADRVTQPSGRIEDALSLMRTLIGANPERVVWGTDWPHIGFHGDKVGREPPVLPHRRLDQRKLLALLAEACPDEATFKRILVDNPARLYGFA